MSSIYVGIYLQVEPPLILEGESEQAFMQSIIEPSSLETLDSNNIDKLVANEFKIYISQTKIPALCTDFEAMKELFMQNNSRIIADLIGFYRQNKFTAKIGMWEE